MNCFVNIYSLMMNKSLLKMIMTIMIIYNDDDDDVNDKIIKVMNVKE